MKLKDLIFNREKLRKYDELKEWVDKLGDKNIFGGEYYIVKGDVIGWVRIPNSIRDIFVSALESEIAKLDE